jgi:phospholipase/carboxylesterase
MATGGRRHQSEEARMHARPGKPSGDISPGLHPLGLDAERDALLYVPAGYRPEYPAPFVLSLHGAGGNARAGLYPLHGIVATAGLVLISPASRGRTWDILLGGFGPDIEFIDRTLTAAFARCAVDPGRVGVSGFSDGGSYALSISIANGDLLRRVLAFSPGFAAPRGEPRCFVSHGTEDTVLPIDRTSRRIVPQLVEAGYEVQYREFDGGHTVPSEIARKGVSWFLPKSAAPAATWDH